MHLYRVTKLFSSVQSIFITESQQNLKNVTLLKENEKLAILLPLIEKKKKTPFLYTIISQHPAQGKKTIEKIHLFIHICIMFYIGPSVITVH